ncbi:MAG TPA: flippase [Gemmatimonadales bacterium]
MARNFLALGGGEVAARVISFGATVYLARTLGAAGYGIIAVAMAIMLYLTYLTDCGVEVLGVREVAAAPAQVGKLVPPVLSLRLAVAATTVLIVAVLGLTVLPQPDGAVLAGYSLILLAVGGNTRWVHLGLERAGFAALARAAGEATMLIIVLVLLRDAGDLGRVPLAQFTGDMLAAILLGWGLSRVGHRLIMRWDLGEASPVVRQGSWLAANAIVGLLIYNSDLIFLRIFRTPQEVGRYAAAYTLISFLLNLGVTYGQSLLPTFTRLNPDPAEQRSLYHAAMAQVYAGAMPLAVGGSLVAGGLLLLVFGPQFITAATALVILLWSIPVAFFRNVPQTALIAAGRQEWVFRFTLISAVLNLVLNLAVIPRWGMLGAALATLGTEIVRTTITLRGAVRAGFPLPSPGKFWRASIATVAMAAVLLVFRPGPVVASIFLGALTYCAVLILAGGIRLRRGMLPELTL